jgi:inosose dehydratase
MRTDIPMQRRDFLRMSSAAALGVTLPGLLTAKDEDPYGGFILGIQTYTFRKFTLEQAVKKINGLGVRYAEFYRGHIPTNSTPQQIKAALALCKEHNVTPIAFGVERFSKDHDANKKLFDFAAALGVKHLSADPDPDSFDSLDKLVAEFNISIAIHPHGPAGKGLHRWYSAEVILKAVEKHHALIGTCLDTGHLIRSAQMGQNLDPVQQIKVMGARNFGLHLKDHDNKRKTDVIYGQDGGVLDVAGILRALREVKFKGYISIEYEANPDEPTKDVQACLDVFRQTVKKL